MILLQGTNTTQLQLLAQLAVNSTAALGFTLRDGVIHKKGKIWLGFNPGLQAKVTMALHASDTGGHSGSQ